MALTVTEVDRYVIGDRVEVVVDVQFDSAYVTGGEPLSKEDLGLELGLTFVMPAGMARNTSNAGANAVGVSYDHTNEKLQAYYVGSHSHTENTAASYTQNATTGNAAGAKYLEVPGSTDLANWQARLRCVGKSVRCA